GAPAGGVVYTVVGAGAGAGCAPYWTGCPVLYGTGCTCDGETGWVAGCCAKHGVERMTKCNAAKSATNHEPVRILSLHRQRSPAPPRLARREPSRKGLFWVQVLDRPAISGRPFAARVSIGVHTAALVWAGSAERSERGAPTWCYEWPANGCA